MAIIKKIGTAAKSRNEARELAKANNGKVIDMAQKYENPVNRWVVLADKVLTLKNSRSALADVKILGRTTVHSKRSALACLAANAKAA